MGNRFVITAWSGSSVFWRKLEIAARTFFWGNRRSLGIDAGLLDARSQQVLGVLAVEDREVGRNAQPLAVDSQDAVGDVVERAAPDVLGLLLDEQLDAVEHLAGRPVREGDQHDPAGVHAVMHQPGQPIGQRPRLAAAGPRHDEHRPARRRRHRQLLRIQVRPKIDIPRRRPRLECEFSCHKTRYAVTSVMLPNHHTITAVRSHPPIEQTAATICQGHSTPKIPATAPLPTQKPPTVTQL